MMNDDLPPVSNKSEGINKKEIDNDEEWVNGPTILIILIVAVSTVIYASLNPTERKTREVTSNYSVTVK